MTPYVRCVMALLYVLALPLPPSMQHHAGEAYSGDSHPRSANATEAAPEFSPRLRLSDDLWQETLGRSFGP